MHVNATPYGTMLGSALFEQSCSQRLEKAQSIWGWVKTLYPWWTSTIINIAGKWMFIPLKMVLLGIEYGIDPWTYQSIHHFLPFKTVCVFLGYSSACTSSMDLVAMMTAERTSTDVGVQWRRPSTKSFKNPQHWVCLKIGYIPNEIAI
jgi:hypothetical protein